ncbi:hypothetical protein N0Y54_25040 [Nostoc punctiforme UO1]
MNPPLLNKNLDYSDTTVLFPDWFSAVLSGVVSKENLKVANSDRLKTG